MPCRYGPHFEPEETGAQRGSESCLGGNRGKFYEKEPASLPNVVGRQQKLTEPVKWQRRDLNPRLPTAKVSQKLARLMASAHWSPAASASGALGWAGAGQPLTFTFLKQAQKTSSSGMVGHRELAGPGRAALGTGVSLSRDQARGDRGLSESQPWPCAPSAGTARGGERRRAGAGPSRARLASTQGASWRAGQGREEGREPGREAS